MARKSKTDSSKITAGTQRQIDAIKSILASKGIAYKSLILFGSVARGDASANSDIDLCLIVDDKTKDIDSVRLAANQWVARAGIAADILATTERQFQKDMVLPILHEIRTYGFPI